MRWSENEKDEEGVEDKGREEEEPGNEKRIEKMWGEKDEPLKRMEKMKKMIRLGWRENEKGGGDERWRKGRKKQEMRGE